MGKELPLASSRSSASLLTLFVAPAECRLDGNVEAHMGRRDTQMEKGPVVTNGLPRKT